MNNLIGKKVKMFFKNGMSAEGILNTWSQDVSILNSVDGPGCLYINKTSENVLFVKTFEELTKVQKSSVDFKMKNVPLPELPPPVLNERETNLDLRAVKLADLRKAQLEEQQRQLKEKMNSFQLKAPVEVTYDYPKKFGIMQRSGTQANAVPQRDAGKLQPMSRKKG